MNKTVKILILVIIGLLILPGAMVKAQETGTVEAEEPIIGPVPIAPPPTQETEKKVIQEILEDENIIAEDLGISDPRILPTSPYYPVKNIWRGFRSTFTFDPIKKAELKLRFANERLFEAQKVAERADKPIIVTKALESYQKEVADVSKILQKAPEEQQEQAEKFTDKMIDNSFKHQRLIDKIERELRPEDFEKLNKARDSGIEHLTKTVSKVLSPEEMQKKFDEVINKQKGSDFKHFKNLEILKAVEEKVPEVAKQAIHQAQENAIKQLEQDMTKIADERREKFKEYVKDVGGNEIRHLEIIHDFEAREIPEIIREEMERAKEKAVQRIDKKMKEFGREEQKREFLRHLEDGKIEDLRIIKELENNLAPETIDQVLEIKNKALDSFRQEFESATTEEEQDKFFREMEEFHDVKQFEVFKEIEKIIPEDKKEFFGKMKEKAMDEMTKEFERGREEGRQEMILHKLAGDMPEHFEIIREFAPPPEIMEDILQEQAERIRDKFEFIQDPKELEFFERRIGEEDFIKEELERRDPEFFRNIETRSDEFRHEIKQDEAIYELEIARKELKHTNEYLAELENKPEIIEHLKQGPVFHHLENAKKHVDEAETALQNEDFGHVFGAATAALHELGNVGRLIKDSELRAEVTDKRIEEMEEMMDLREEMMMEFEDIKQEMMIDEEEITEEMMDKIMKEKALIMEEMMREEERIFDKERKDEVRTEKHKMKIMEEMMKQSIEPEEFEQEIELQFDEDRFSDEEIQKIEQIKQNLPIEIQRTLKNIPSDMILDAMEKLNIKIQDLPSTGARPMPVPIPETGRPDIEPDRM